ncbi:hypothetical protein BC830DRAFT_150178, partial [Chytriomyces sp. MP71]
MHQFTLALLLSFASCSFGQRKVPSSLGGQCGGFIAVPCQVGLTCVGIRIPDAFGTCREVNGVGAKCETSGVQFPPLCEEGMKCFHPKITISMVGLSGTCQVANGTVSDVGGTCAKDHA